MSTTQPNFGKCACDGVATRRAPGGGFECERCHEIEATAAKTYRRRPRCNDPRLKRKLIPTADLQRLMRLACDDAMIRRGYDADISFASQGHRAASAALERKRVFGRKSE
jgi:hypothetical protein